MSSQGFVLVVAAFLALSLGWSFLVESPVQGWMVVVSVVISVAGLAGLVTLLNQWVGGWSQRLQLTFPGGLAIGAAAILPVLALFGFPAAIPLEETYGLVLLGLGTVSVTAALGLTVMVWIN